MKKFIMFFILLTSLYSQNIKNNYFIGANYGDLTIIDNDNTEQYAEGKIGTYFYDENPYLINNRFYLSGAKVLTNNTSFYITKLNLDWIWNQIPFIKPFIGVSAGYIYYAYSTNNYSSGSYGMQAGVLIYLGNHLELEVGGNVDKATEHTDVWTSTLKKLYGGINISF